MRIGARSAVALGFGVAAVAFAVLVFVSSSWAYAAFVAPLIAIAVGLGLANGPASSASTAAVPPDEVGQASGISNMARCIGGALAVAAVATVSTAVTDHHREAGATAADALAAGLSRSALLWRSCPPPASGWRCWCAATAPRDRARSTAPRPRP